MFLDPLCICTVAFDALKTGTQLSSSAITGEAQEKQFDHLALHPLVLYASPEKQIL